MRQVAPVSSRGRSRRIAPCLRAAASASARRRAAASFSDSVRAVAASSIVSTTVVVVTTVGVSTFRSEEHTSELQSHVNLVCRLLLEKKKKKKKKITK